MASRRGWIVGGDVTRRRALAHLLREEGYEAHEMGSAEEAQRRLPESAPDAVLADAGLGDALAELLRAVRARRADARVLVTRDRATEAADAVEWADAFFDRPVNLLELRRALKPEG